LSLGRWRGGTTVVTVDVNPVGDPIEQHEGTTTGPAEVDSVNDADGAAEGDEPALMEPAEPVEPNDPGEILEQDELAGDLDEPEEPDRFTRIRRSTAGAMLTGIGIGLQQIFESPKKQPAFVIKASSDPDGPQGPIDLHFDPDDPTKTVAIIRSQSTDRTSATDRKPDAGPPTG
jgi:hypothetical protein